MRIIIKKTKRNRKSLRMAYIIHHTNTQATYRISKL